MTALLNVIEKKPKVPKKHIQGIPPSQQVNPMAPNTQVQPQRTHKTQTASKIVQTTSAPAFKPVKPQFLVPPGTEPQLPGGHLFGFRPPAGPASGTLGSTFELIYLILTTVP